MKRVTITLYQFQELPEKSQRKAVDDHRYFLLGEMHPNDFISGDPEYDTPEELQKTYEAEYDYYLMNDDPIIENIETNEYYFFHDGTLANCTTYTGGPNKGKTVVTLHGETDTFYEGEN